MSKITKQNLNDENQNSGSCNSGAYNSGNCNSGEFNSGHFNPGTHNSGNWNSGCRNSGDLNSGDWNSGNCNSGFFNSEDPKIILVFNKPISLEIWEECEKPEFIYFYLHEWIPEPAMTEEEKKENPSFHACGGYLKTLSYKEAWRKSWDYASEKDKRLILQLPNFDAQIFEEISGIDVIKELKL